MLKVILMIDCNICGQPFNRIASSTDRDPQAWKCLALDVEYAAERCGWSMLRSAHHCGYCVTDVMLSGQTAAEKALATGDAHEDAEDVDF
jgi:hypothetical protein